MRSALLILACLPFLLLGQYEPKARHFTMQNGLLSQTIFDVFQDEEGAMYITTDKGLQRYNGVHFETISPLILAQLTPIGNKQYVGRTFQDSLAILSIPNSVKAIDLADQHDFADFSFFVAHKERVFRIVGNAVYLFSDRGKVVNEKILETKHTIGDGVIRDNHLVCVSSSILTIDLDDYSVQKTPFLELPGSRLIDIEDRICIAITLEGNEIYEVKDGKIELLNSKIYGPQSVKYTCHAQYKKGEILMGTYNGLYVFDTQFNLKHHYFKGEQISALRVDLSGGIWVGTLNNGLRYIPDLSWLEFSLENLARKTYFSTFCEYPDGFVAGTFNGQLFFFDSQGQIKDHLLIPTNTEILTIGYDAQARQILFYAEDLYRYDLRSKKLSAQHYGGRSIKSIRVDEGELYLATNSGLNLNEQNLLLPNDWIYELELWDQRIFSVTSKGTYVHDKKGKTLLPQFSPEDRQILKNTRHIRRSKNALYLATTHAIYRMERNSLKTVAHFDKGEIENLYLRENELYVLSEQTISTFDLKKGKWLAAGHSFNGSDVIGMARFANQFYLIKRSGIDQFALQSQVTSRHAPRIFLRSIEGDFKRNNGVLEAFGTENSMMLHVEVLPNYSSTPGQIRYRLKGLDPRWTVLNNGIFDIKETRIPFGTYTLEIEYSKDGNHWSEPYKLQLKVIPLVYQTLWFKALVVVLLGLLCFVLIKRQFRIYRRKADERFEKERLKRSAISSELKALRAQMNPHFIFNSLSTIQTKILEKNQESAYHNLNAFSKLLRQSLEFTSREWISMKDELDFIGNYIRLEEERFNNSITHDLIIEFEGELDKVMFPSLLTQPFVENAFRHGLMHREGDRSLEIKLLGKPRAFTISIRDNGIGIEASALINKNRSKVHKSFAVASVKERIALLNRSKLHHFALDIQSDSSGTTVTIQYSQKS